MYTPAHFTASAQAVDEIKDIKKRAEASLAKEQKKSKPATVEDRMQRWQNQCAETQAQLDETQAASSNLVAAVNAAKVCICRHVVVHSSLPRSGLGFRADWVSRLLLQTPCRPVASCVSGICDARFAHTRKV